MTHLSLKLALHFCNTFAYIVGLWPHSEHMSFFLILEELEFGATQRLIGYNNFRYSGLYLTERAARHLQAPRAVGTASCLRRRRAVKSLSTSSLLSKMRKTQASSKLAKSLRYVLLLLFYFFHSQITVVVTFCFSLCEKKRKKKKWKRKRKMGAFFEVTGVSFTRKYHFGLSA